MSAVSSVSIIFFLLPFHTRSLTLSLTFSEGSSNTHGGGGGAQSRPLVSDDLRLIEEDLSKQLSVDTVDRDQELNTEPFICTLENGGEVATYCIKMHIQYSAYIENIFTFLAIKYYKERTVE